MNRSRSRRQVVLLDCCHSGAFKEGMLAKSGDQAAGGEQLQGQARIVLTASDALQYSFEGDAVQGTGKRSVFTRILVEGLESGHADMDEDGLFSVDDVYKYISHRMRDERIQQRPVKMGIIEGDVFLGNNPQPKAANLPRGLVEDMGDRHPEIRRRAIDELHLLLIGDHKGRALAAHEALLRLKDDDSRQVSTAAAQYIEQYLTKSKKGTEQNVVATHTELPRKSARWRALFGNWWGICLLVVIYVAGVVFCIAMATPVRDDLLSWNFVFLGLGMFRLIRSIRRRREAKAARLVQKVAG
jgi:hypothetical protein